MNYKKHYDLLINRSKNRTLEGYVEKHHILPRCLGGSDHTENIAILTPEEHFLAHQLLVKLYPGHQGLAYAAQLMTTHQTGHRVNNKLFGWIRKRMSEYTKARLKEKGHPKGMLGKKHTEKIKLQIAASSKVALTAAKGVAIYAYNMDGTFYKAYDSISECGSDLKTSPSNVKYTADGDFGYCKNKQIRYVYTDKIDPYVKPKSKLIGYIKSESHVENIKNSMTNNNSTCSHCGITSSKSVITRRHNDNCKYRTN